MASAADRSKEHVAADQQIKRLQYQLSQRTKEGDKLAAVNKEKEQVEELLLQTQRENERCEEEVKRWKSYAKNLEQQIEKLAGANWQQRLDVAPTPGPASLHTSLHAPSTPVGGIRRGSDDNSGWLAGPSTPVTAFKTSRVYGQAASKGSDAIGANTHKRSNSAGYQMLAGSPDVTQVEASQTNDQDVKARRRVSAFYDHEEMILPALKRQGSHSPGSLQDDWTTSPQQENAPEPPKIMRTSATAEQIVPPVKAQQVAPEEAHAPSLAPPIAAPLPIIDDALAQKILDAVKGVSSAQSSAAKDSAAARKAQSDAQVRLDAEQRRRQEDLKRFVQQQRGEMREYVASVESEAEHRMEVIREMMREAQAAAAEARRPPSAASGFGAVSTPKLTA